MFKNVLIIWGVEQPIPLTEKWKLASDSSHLQLHFSEICILQLLHAQFMVARIASLLESAWKVVEMEKWPNFTSGFHGANVKSRKGPNSTTIIS